MKKMFLGALAVLLVSVLVGCGNTVGVTPNMNEVFTAMAEHLPEEAAPFDVQIVFDTYGIDPAACKQEVVLSYYDGTQTAELWMIEAVDQTATETIRTLAQERLESMGAQFRAYDAAAFALTEKATLLTHGNCLVMIVAENAESLLTIYQSAAALV